MNGMIQKIKKLNAEPLIVNVKPSNICIDKVKIVFKNLCFKYNFLII